MKSIETRAIIIGGGATGCGTLRDDPLGIHPMLDRCRRAAEEGRREFLLPPVLPVLGCRI